MGLCAVAHAYAQPVADPNEPADAERLSANLPIVQALAEHLNEFELGVKLAATIRKYLSLNLRASVSTLAAA